MREIKFRGVAAMSIEELDRLDIPHASGWAYGNLLIDGGISYIVGPLAEVADDYIAHEWWVRVVPRTVGQYAGLKDKNGVEIYEGDVLKVPDFYETPENTNETHHYEKVYFEHGSFRTDNGVGDEDWDYISDECEIIGNIYENKDLLS